MRLVTACADASGISPEDGRSRRFNPARNRGLTQFLVRSMVKTIALWHALTHNMVLHVASARADDHGRHQGLAGLDTRKFAMPIRQILARPAASAIGPSSARVLGDERL
jgi:hypothetical protein